MDLVEIRNKARKKDPKNIKRVEPKNRKQQPDPKVQTGTKFDSGLSNAHDLSHSETKHSQDNTNAEIVSALDVLDELLEDHPDQVLATEQTYLQSLDRDRSLTAGHVEKGQWLAFRLGQELYALDIVNVREIIKPRNITDLPRMPAFVLGVISLRGIIVPIYDLRRRLNLGMVEVDTDSRIIICEQEKGLVGLLVDKITQVVLLGKEDIEPPLAILSGLDRALVEGVGRVQGQMFICLDLSNVLDMELK